jgi:hypothetical protein
MPFIFRFRLDRLMFSRLAISSRQKSGFCILATTTSFNVLRKDSSAFVIAILPVCTKGRSP